MMKYIYLLFIFLFISCSSDERKPNFGNKKFLEMARKGDPDLELVIPASISETVVHCSDYTPPCRYGLKVIVKKIPMKALFYENQLDALEAGKRIKGYVARNWVLDEVAGEPILERFVTKYLEAKKASEIKKP